jgi:branched-chain amino acid transport system ATP-binding protein
MRIWARRQWIMSLAVEDLRVSYGNIKALHGLNFQIDDGEIVCIIGANGAGKSTTLKAISRLVPVEPGSKMTFQGNDLLIYPADKVVSKLGISHVPEGRRLFDNLTVTENLQLATFARKDRDHIQKDLTRVFSIFPRLEEREGQKAGTLSGGEQQMLAVGRAYMSGRKAMLLDEPSMGLAPLLMMSTFDALKEINQEGTTILLVEQNARMALQFARRGYVLENGSLVLEGPSEELLENPDVKKAYLGG